MTTRARGAQAGTIRCQYGIETQPAYRGGVFALIGPEFVPGSLLFDHSGSRSTFVASAAVLLAAVALTLLAARAGRIQAG